MMAETEDSRFDRLLAEHPKGQYGEAWVAYLDILGYRDLMRQAEESGHPERFIGRLRLDLALARAGGEMAQGDGMVESFRVFSDSICVAARGPLAVSDFVYVLTDVVGRLAGAGIFVRGAAVRGGHYDDGIVLFSPAFVRAYDTEQHQAFYPRVIMEDKVVGAYQAWVLGYQKVASGETDVARYRNRLWRDRDGRWFLNYLMLCEDIRANVGEDAALGLLARHRDQIMQNLADTRENPRIATKYHWLAHYHNRYCRFALTDEELNTFLIDAGDQ